MPHIVLEHSANARAAESSSDLLNSIFEIINESFGIATANCKGRIRIANDFLVGSGSEDEAFVHLQFKLIAGREAEKKRVCGERLLEFLKTAFAPSENPKKLQLTVEITDAPREFYFKHSVV